MVISFEIAGEPAKFRWSNMTGRAFLTVHGERLVLSRVVDPTTHFHPGTRRSWNRKIGAHSVEIVKVRPQFFGPFRPNRFSVLVDGVSVAERSGL